MKKSKKRSHTQTSRDEISSNRNILKVHFCRFAHPPLNFSVPLSARNQLVPRSLLRFEVPGSANKAVICRAGCCVAVCHVPRRHEIAFRSKRAKMAREERITCMCVCVCVCTSVCACGGCIARRLCVYLLQTFARPRAFWSANGRRNCAWITPARFALSVSPVFVTRFIKKKREREREKKGKNAGRPACQRNRLRRFSFVLTLRRGLHQSACNRHEDVCETPLAVRFVEFVIRERKREKEEE